MWSFAAMSSEGKAALILGGIVFSEGAWLIVNAIANPAGLLRFCGFGRPAGFPAWAFALAIAFGFVFYAARLPSVRSNLLRFGGLKLLAIGVAISAGFCEEAIFRKQLMDYGMRLGWSVVWQIVVSALAFGAAHAIWGLFRGSVAAALGAMAATGSLGFLLAATYLAGGRNLAPCIISHLLINVFAEPGLVLAAVRGEMRRQA
jgi:hypothetical protein